MLNTSSGEMVDSGQLEGWGFCFLGNLQLQTNQNHFWLKLKKALVLLGELGRCMALLNDRHKELKGSKCKSAPFSALLHLFAEGKKVPKMANMHPTAVAFLQLLHSNF